MDISRFLPDPIPEGWEELEKKLRELEKEHDLDNIAFCAQQLLAERADAKVVETLRPLLNDFPTIKCLHVYHDGGWDGTDCFRVYIEMQEGAKETREIRQAKKWIKVLVENPKFKAVADPIEFSSWLDFKMHTQGSELVKILDRTTE